MALKEKALKLLVTELQKEQGLPISQSGGGHLNVNDSHNNSPAAKLNQTISHISNPMQRKKFAETEGGPKEFV